jgi:hypothetical protein
MKNISTMLIILLLATIPILSTASSERLSVKAVNILPAERKSQIIELSIKDLMPFGEKDLARIRVQSASG